MQLANVPSLQGVITAGTGLPSTNPTAPARNPLTEYNSLSWSRTACSALLPPWRPARDSGALKAGTGPECQVLLFLINDADWKKEAQISFSLSLRWGEGPNFQGHRTRLWHYLVSPVDQPVSTFPGQPAGKFLTCHASLPPYFPIIISCHGEVLSNSLIFPYSLHKPPQVEMKTSTFCNKAASSPGG